MKNKKTIRFGFLMQDKFLTKEDLRRELTTFAYLE